MVTSAQAFAKYGDPRKESNMTLWDVPPVLQIGVIPKKLYCNKDIIAPLSNAFAALISSGCVKELKTFDGCFNVRKKAGLQSQSLHSWGIAVDLNAAWNGLNVKPVLSAAFVKCFTDKGFDWGGTWKRIDGMHFQLAKI